MNVFLVSLRQRGALIDLPHIRAIDDVPPLRLIDGLLEYGRLQGVKGLCLHLRCYMSAPGHGVKAMLFQPALAVVDHDFIKFRGFEIADDGVHMQEWLVFPKSVRLDSDRSDDLKA